MNFRVQTSHTEDEIRVCSYLIWKREGCPEGKSEEYWLRAIAELEAEFKAECTASLAGKSTTFVVPLLLVSSLPTRVDPSEALLQRNRPSPTLTNDKRRNATVR
jgi:hypothetical protein